MVSKTMLLPTNQAARQHDSSSDGTIGRDLFGEHGRSRRGRERGMQPDLTVVTIDTVTAVEATLELVTVLSLATLLYESCERGRAG